MELNKDRATTEHITKISTPLCDRQVNSDICRDIVLPDYYPEIRRVLYISDAIMPPARFINGKRAELSGVAEFTMVYLSAQGGLCSAPIDAEYEFSLPLENVSDIEMSDGITLIAHTVAETASVRVNGPRKLQLRANLRTSVLAFGKRIFAQSIEGNCDDMQRQQASAICAELAYESYETLTLDDEFTLHGRSERIAVAECGVEIDEESVEGGRVSVRGSVIVELLAVDDENGSPSERIVRRLPFFAENDIDTPMDTSEVETNSERLLCRAVGRVSELSVVCADTQGEEDDAAVQKSGRVSIQANLLLELCICRNIGIEYTKDAYSICNEVVCEAESIMLPVVTENRRLTIPFECRCDPEESGEEDRGRVVDCRVCAVLDGIQKKQGKYLLSMTIKYAFLFEREGEYDCLEIKRSAQTELEPSHPLESAEEGRLCRYDATAVVLSSKADTENGALQCRGELCISLMILEDVRADMVGKILLLQEKKEERNEWIVAYVADDFDVWQTAKRYSVPCDAISGDDAKQGFVIIEKE